MPLNSIRPDLDLDPCCAQIKTGSDHEDQPWLMQILTFRRLAEGIKAKNLTAVLTFVDFKKAFDLVNRNK